MLLHEVCKGCGLTKKAVAYYVEQGLVQPVLLENGYRDFSPDAVERLKRIAILRRLGLSVLAVKEVLESGGQAALERLARQRAFDLDCEAQRQALLLALAEGEDWASVKQGLDDLERKQAILTRLTNAFPGSYGNYIRLHFARYLREPIASREQEDAYKTVVDFLDNMDFSLPPDLEEALEQAAAHLDEQSVAASLEAAIRDPQAYLAEHREMLDAYLAYKASEEYKGSKAGRLQEALERLNRESGYYEVFLPAMKRLSPAYRACCEGMERADAAFRRQYPNAAL